jgi:ATP-dependent protease ClpP protease subunit
MPEPIGTQSIYLLPINGVIGEDFKYTDLLMHLNAAKDYPVIKQLINSPGGFVDEAEKMRDALDNSGKIIISTNIGDVASAAVDLFLAAPKPNRTFDPTKGQFVIHFPFIDPKDGGVTGTASEIETVAKEMKRMESDLVKQYVKATGTDANILAGFMGENIPLTPEQIQTLGFATVIQPQQLKAVAYYKSLNNNNMEQKEVIEKLSGLEKVLQKISNWIRPRAMVVQDVSGKELDFGETITDASQIQPGVIATVDGAPADGDFTLPDGSVYTFVKGALQTITPAAGSELESLKKENEQLKADLATANAAKAQLETDLVAFKASAETQINGVKTELIAFRNQFSKSEPPTNKPDVQNTGKKGVFKKEEIEKW